MVIHYIDLWGFGPTGFLRIRGNRLGVPRRSAISFVLCWGSLAFLEITMHKHMHR